MKDDCDYITKADNNQGGVGEAIEKFVLERWWGKDRWNLTRKS
jgi:hypothetical protein